MSIRPDKRLPRSFLQASISLVQSDAYNSVYTHKISEYIKNNFKESILIALYFGCKILVKDTFSLFIHATVYVQDRTFVFFFLFFDKYINRIYR